MPDCPFCQQLNLENYLPGNIRCRRDIYSDKFCFAILAPEQYTAGHSLVILKKHKIDIADDISGDDLAAFIVVINKIAKRIKDRVENDRKEKPERIYVGILCDGVQHLHAHLIPRYPFSDEDKTVYKNLFFSRDGRVTVDETQQKGDMGGYWYIAQREINYKQSEFNKKPVQVQASVLEELASKLRN